jgi:small subunit ribosomal protein S6
MKEYELTVLIHPDLEIDIETPLKKVRDLIASANGEIISEENWGKKRLAYKIKKQDFAVYAFFDISLPSEAPLKISNTLNITDEVLRYLLVAADLKGRLALEEAKKSETSNETTTEKE